MSVCVAVVGVGGGVDSGGGGGIIDVVGGVDVDGHRIVELLLLNCCRSKLYIY